MLVTLETMHDVLIWATFHLWFLSLNINLFNIIIVVFVIHEICNVICDILRLMAMTYLFIQVIQRSAAIASLKATHNAIII